MPETAHIAVPIALDKEFDYSVPAGLKIKKGMRVLVDFNGRKRVGLVVDLSARSKFKNLKPVIEALDSEPSLSKEHMQFALSLSRMYPYPKAEFLFMMLPSYLRKAKKISLSQNLPQAGEKEKTAPQKNLFIKADSFLERYRLWKPVVEEKLKTGSALVCFPQLSYLEAARQVLEKDFASHLKVIHSQIKEKDFFNTWRQSRVNSLILGTRVSIFHYPYDLGLIVVEEENSPYYFQEEKPYHNLLDVAFLLARFKDSALILSSDFPSLSAYKLIRDKEMILRDNSSPGKNIKVIGASEYSKKKVVSPVLIELLRKNIQAKKSSVVLWNKKGFGRFIRCSACGHIFKCSHCSGFLRLSLKSSEGVCPYCQKKEALPKICPHCKKGYLKNSGWGIERIEGILRKEFPEAKINTWESRGPESKIILSTSKILSFLYGKETFDSGYVLDTDHFLARADYEAAFDTFLYLKKLCFFFKEELCVFTGNGQYYLFKYLNKDWKEFYEAEMGFREKLNLPPFGIIVKITLRAKDKNNLLKQAQYLYNKLEEKKYQVYGPLEEEPFKLRDKFRYSLVIKAPRSFALRKAIKEDLKKLRVSAQMAVSLK